MPTKRSIPFSLKLIAGIIVFIGMFVIAMVFGAAETTIKDVWFALTTSMQGEKLSILREIRLPREVAAILVGASLAVSGAIMQGITRNPLADPGLLGLTSGDQCGSGFYAGLHSYRQLFRHYGGLLHWIGGWGCHGLRNRSHAKRRLLSPADGVGRFSCLGIFVRHRRRHRYLF
ncbi:transport system permease protein [Paenibacillus vortex V453]|uniref:Transport system permease protein n=1 Tax=Paenibacillus vortex V453 TaxID=715225 RepID=A0A2R9T2D4_9BACL|nr:transport system permease protein [Paenibacillus vortex V453]